MTSIQAYTGEDDEELELEPDDDDDVSVCYLESFTEVVYELSDDEADDVNADDDCIELDASDGIIEKENIDPEMAPEEVGNETKMPEEEIDEEVLAEVSEKRSEDTIPDEPEISSTSEAEMLTVEIHSDGDLTSDLIYEGDDTESNEGDQITDAEQVGAFECFKPLVDSSEKMMYSDGVKEIVLENIVTPDQEDEMPDLVENNTDETSTIQDTNTSSSPIIKSTPADHLSIDPYIVIDNASEMNQENVTATPIIEATVDNQPLSEIKQESPVDSESLDVAEFTPNDDLTVKFEDVSVIYQETDIDSELAEESADNQESDRIINRASPVILPGQVSVNTQDTAIIETAHVKEEVDEASPTTATVSIEETVEDQENTPDSVPKSEDCSSEEIVSEQLLDNPTVEAELIESAVVKEEFVEAEKSHEDKEITSFEIDEEVVGVSNIDTTVKEQADPDITTHSVSITSISSVEVVAEPIVYVNLVAFDEDESIPDNQQESEVIELCQVKEEETSIGEQQAETSEEEAVHSSTEKQFHESQPDTETVEPVTVKEETTEDNNITNTATIETSVEGKLAVLNQSTEIIEPLNVKEKLAVSATSSIYQEINQESSIASSSPTIATDEADISSEATIETPAEISEIINNTREIFTSTPIVESADPVEENQITDSSQEKEITLIEPQVSETESSLVETANVKEEELDSATEAETNIDSQEDNEQSETTQTLSTSPMTESAEADEKSLNVNTKEISPEVESIEIAFDEDIPHIASGTDVVEDETILPAARIEDQEKDAVIKSAKTNEGQANDVAVVIQDIQIDEVESTVTNEESVTEELTLSSAIVNTVNIQKEITSDIENTCQDEEDNETIESSLIGEDSTFIEDIKTIDNVIDNTSSTMEAEERLVITASINIPAKTEDTSNNEQILLSQKTLTPPIDSYEFDDVFYLDKIIDTPVKIMEVPDNDPAHSDVPSGTSSLEDNVQLEQEKSTSIAIEENIQFGEEADDTPHHISIADSTFEAEVKDNGHLQRETSTFVEALRYESSDTSDVSVFIAQPDTVSLDVVTSDINMDTNDKIDVLQILDEIDAKKESESQQEIADDITVNTPSTAIEDIPDIADEVKPESIEEIQHAVEVSKEVETPKTIEINITISSNKTEPVDDCVIEEPLPTVNRPVVNRRPTIEKSTDTPARSRRARRPTIDQDNTPIAEPTRTMRSRRATTDSESSEVVPVDKALHIPTSIAEEETTESTKIAEYIKSTVTSKTTTRTKRGARAVTEEPISVTPVEENIVECKEKQSVTLMTSVSETEETNISAVLLTSTTEKLIANIVEPIRSVPVKEETLESKEDQPISLTPFEEESAKGMEDQPETVTSSNDEHLSTIDANPAEITTSTIEEETPKPTRKQRETKAAVVSKSASKTFRTKRGVRALTEEPIAAVVDSISPMPEATENQEEQPISVTRIEEEVVESKEEQLEIINLPTNSVEVPSPATDDKTPKATQNQREIKSATASTSTSKTSRTKRGARAVTEEPISAIIEKDTAENNEDHSETENTQVNLSTDEIQSELVVKTEAEPSDAKPTRSKRAARRPTVDEATIVDIVSAKKVPAKRVRKPSVDVLTLEAKNVKINEEQPHIAKEPIVTVNSSIDEVKQSNSVVKTEEVPSEDSKPTRGKRTTKDKDVVAKNVPAKRTRKASVDVRTLETVTEINAPTEIEPEEVPSKLPARRGRKASVIDLVIETLPAIDEAEIQQQISDSSKIPAKRGRKAATLDEATETLPVIDEDQQQAPVKLQTPDSNKKRAKRGRKASVIDQTIETVPVIDEEGQQQATVQPQISDSSKMTAKRGRKAAVIDETIENLPVNDEDQKQASVDVNKKPAKRGRKASVTEPVIDTPPAINEVQQQSPAQSKTANTKPAKRARKGSVIEQAIVMPAIDEVLKSQSKRVPTKRGQKNIESVPIPDVNTQTTENAKSVSVDPSDQPMSATKRVPAKRAQNAVLDAETDDSQSVPSVKRGRGAAAKNVIEETAKVPLNPIPDVKRAPAKRGRKMAIEHDDEADQMTNETQITPVKRVTPAKIVLIETPEAKKTKKAPPAKRGRKAAFVPDEEEPAKEVPTAEPAKGRRKVTAESPIDTETETTKLPVTKRGRKASVDQLPDTEMEVVEILPIKRVRKFTAKAAEATVPDKKAPPPKRGRKASVDQVIDLVEDKPSTESTTTLPSKRARKPSIDEESNTDDKKASSSRGKAEAKPNAPAKRGAAPLVTIDEDNDHQEPVKKESKPARATARTKVVVDLETEPVTKPTRSRGRQTKTTSIELQETTSQKSPKASTSHRKSTEPVAAEKPVEVLPPAPRPTRTRARKN